MPNDGRSDENPAGNTTGENAGKDAGADAMETTVPRQWEKCPDCKRNYKGIPGNCPFCNLSNERPNPLSELYGPRERR